MALSNWDMMAFDNDGKPSNGTFISHRGIKVEIYKNIVYVGHDKMWRKGDFAKPKIACISEGYLRIIDTSIHAIRGPQSSVMVYVESISHKNNKSSIIRMCGVGAYGYEDVNSKILDDAGLKSRRSDAHITTDTDSDGNHSVSIYLPTKNGGLRRWRVLPFKSRYNPKWVGTEDSTVKFMFNWLDKIIYERGGSEWLNRCKKSTPMRFCQGDRYFASKIGASIDEISTTVGNARTPVMSSILTALNGDAK